MENLSKSNVFCGTQLVQSGDNSRYYHNVDFLYASTRSNKTSQNSLSNVFCGTQLVQSGDNSRYYHNVDFLYASTRSNKTSQNSVAKDEFTGLINLIKVFASFLLFIIIILLHFILSEANQAEESDNLFQTELGMDCNEKPGVSKVISFFAALNTKNTNFDFEFFVGTQTILRGLDSPDMFRFGLFFILLSIYMVPPDKTWRYPYRTGLDAIDDDGIKNKVQHFLRLCYYILLPGCFFTDEKIKESAQTRKISHIRIVNSLALYRTPIANFFSKVGISWLTMYLYRQSLKLKIFIGFYGYLLDALSVENLLISLSNCQLIQKFVVVLVAVLFFVIMGGITKYLIQKVIIFQLQLIYLIIVKYGSKLINFPLQVLYLIGDNSEKSNTVKK